MAHGFKSGGRKRGTPNRATAALAAAVAASGETPLAYLLSVMRDPQVAPELRLEAAKAAAPFVHPRLSAVSVQTQIDDRRDAETRRVLIDQITNFIDHRPTRQIEGAVVEVSPQHRIV